LRLIKDGQAICAGIGYNKGVNEIQSIFLPFFEAQPLFRGLGQKDRDAIAAAAQFKRLQAGEFYFLQGDPAERIYLLGQGRVRLSQSSADGQQVLLRVIEGGVLFGAVAMTQAAVYPVSAEAAEK